MTQQEKLNREDILKKFNISEDILSSYERELDLVCEPDASGIETFTQEDIDSICTVHKLREAGLTYNEIKLLTSFAGVLKDVEFESESKIKDLLLLSPTSRLKQSLSMARQELDKLKKKAEELEDTIRKLSEASKNDDDVKLASLRTEIEAKEKSFNSLDRKLQETLLAKAHLEAELASYKEGKNGTSQIKGKKAKELYRELTETKKKIEESTSKLQEEEGRSQEYLERLELMEEDMVEMEHEVEEKYQEQITSLRSHIEELIEKKQKEWEIFYTESSEIHKKELLTLQRKHEQEVLRLKQKIREQIEEIEMLKARSNPLLELFRIGSMQK